MAPASSGLRPLLAAAARPRPAAGPRWAARAGYGPWHRLAGGARSAAAQATGFGTDRQQRTWDLLEYNAHYFNPHRTTSILSGVLELPRDDTLSDPRLEAYLVRAQAAAQVFENWAKITAKDMALSIVAAREVGHAAAEELSEILVATITQQIRKLDMRRVSFFITAFAKHGILDKAFWKVAADVVAQSNEPISPQLVVSFFDAFRKSGLKRQELYRALTRRALGEIDSLAPAHVPPILATIVRVPLEEEARERAIRALLGRWLSALRLEREHPTGAVTMSQVVSLSVSLTLAPEEINTAVFARDVAAYVADRFAYIDAEDLIVFLWALQSLVAAGALPAFLTLGLRRVLEVWPELSSTSQLSIQRLTQLSDVVVAVRRQGRKDDEILRLQQLLVKELADTVQFCDATGLAEILEIWQGTQKFWTRYADFAEAIAMRMEEVLLESADMEDVMALLRAATSNPGLVQGMSEPSRQCIAQALRGRGAADFERTCAILAGTPWEELCGGAPAPGVASTPAAGADARLDVDEAAQQWTSDFADAFASALGMARSSDDHVRALESAAPLARRFGASIPRQAFELLHECGDRLAAEADGMPPAQLLAALRACAVSGLPHAELFRAAPGRLAAGDLGPLAVVDAFEAAASLRLALPEWQLWLEDAAAAGLVRRLPGAALARLGVASARLGFLDAPGADALLHRFLTVVSPERPPAPAAFSALCQGLFLAGWPPGDERRLRRLAAWLQTALASPRTPSQRAAFQSFALGVLADAGGRDAAGRLAPELRGALAAAAAARGEAGPGLASDTALKLRHEVAEVLRRAGQAYDLSPRFGPGISADLELLAAPGALWFLDGPEAFHHPFPADAQDAGELRLTPFERRRGDLLSALASPSGPAERIRDALADWGGAEAAAALPQRLGRAPPVARLSWLEWSGLPPQARLRRLVGEGAAPRA